MKTRIIAIDGPAGSGKSTTAKRVAKKLGFLYLDTGAMYRAITVKVLDQGIDPKSDEEVSRIARSSHLEIKPSDCSYRILLDGKDVTERIRTLQIDENVSFVSEHRTVRETLVNKQREIGKTQDVVVEGRDITTVVFPHAFIKIYLDCDIEERAKRKTLEFKDKSSPTSFEQQKKGIALRDEIDSGRELSPLKKAKDAFVIDTTELTIKQQVKRVIQIYKEAIS